MKTEGVKTAMQEVIDYLITTKSKIEPMTYGFLMHRCITALELEKQQIIEAVNNTEIKCIGMANDAIFKATNVRDLFYHSKESGEDYFTQTYNP